MIFEQQNQKNFPEKNLFSEKNLGKNKIWEKNLKNIFEKILNFFLNFK